MSFCRTVRHISEGRLFVGAVRYIMVPDHNIKQAGSYIVA